MQAELFQKLVHQIKQSHIWTKVKAIKFRPKELHKENIQYIPNLGNTETRQQGIQIPPITLTTPAGDIIVVSVTLA